MKSRMYDGLIGLTDLKTSKGVYVYAPLISLIRETDGGHSRIYLGWGFRHDIPYIDVAESPDEVADLCYYA